MSEKNSSTIKLDKNSELRRARRTKLFFVFLLFILLVLGGVVGFLRKKEFQISEITVTGTKSLDSNIVIKTAQEYLNGHYAIIIPKTNTLLLSKSDLISHIFEQIPSIEKASVAFKAKNSIEIFVTEKKPSYVWCNTSCYFVDDSGMIYEESPRFTNGIFVTFLGGQVEGDPIKKYFVSQEQFATLQKILSAIDQISIHVVGITIGENIEIHVDSIRGNILGSTTTIIVTPTESAQTVTDALTLLMNDKSFMGNVAAKGKLLQYIDIRFPDKIYYKFDTPAAQVTATPPTTNAKLLEKTQ